MLNQKKIVNLWRKCGRVQTSFIFVLLRYMWYRFNRKNILASDRVTIYGLFNISTSNVLEVGLRYTGFTNRYDRTFLNVEGKLNFNGKFSIAKGCRFDIGRNAIATFGSGYINPNTLFVIMNGITIGDGCAISWGCQFLDEDFHKINYPNKLIKLDSRIEIGSNVWIGSNVTVLRGVVIPDGCVIASGSVVVSKFHAQNALIAGNPAQVIRENICWK